MNLKEFREELLKDSKFRKEYYDSDDWVFRNSLIIREQRIKKGLTQKALANLIGTKQPSIARLENGISKSPKIDFLKRIARALEIDLVPPEFNPNSFYIKTITWEINSILDGIFVQPSNIMYFARFTNQASTTDLININELSPA